MTEEWLAQVERDFGGDYQRVTHEGCFNVAKLLLAEVRPLRARSIPALTWIRENGESTADHGCFRLEVWRRRDSIQWNVQVGRAMVASGDAASQADGEAKAEAALLVACGVKS